MSHKDIIKNSQKEQCMPHSSDAKCNYGLSAHGQLQQSGRYDWRSQNFLSSQVVQMWNLWGGAW